MFQDDCELEKHFCLSSFLLGFCQTICFPFLCSFLRPLHHSRPPVAKEKKKDLNASVLFELNLFVDFYSPP